MLCVLSSLLKMWMLKGKAQKDLISVYKYLIGECKDEPLLFSVVPGGRTRDNEQKLKHMNSTGI